MPREAMELLAVLEARARRGEFRQPVVDLVALTEDSESAKRVRRP
jgi:hypothetical protein